MLGAIQLNDLSVAASMGLHPALLPTSYSPDVTLAPATNTRNLVQPVADVSALRLQQQTLGSTQPVLSIETPTGQVLKRTSYSLSGPNANLDLLPVVGSASKYAFMEIGYWLQNGSASPTTVELFGFGAEGNYSNAAALTNYDFYIFDYHTNRYVMYVDGSGQGRLGIGTQTRAAIGGMVHILPPTVSMKGMILQAQGSYLADFLEVWDSSSNVLLALLPTADVAFSRVDSTSVSSQVAQITASFAVNTHASYQGRLELAADSFGGLFPAIRIEATGTAAAIGFLGHAVQVLPAAYTITNPISNRSFDTTTVTTQQLAQVVGTILSDMKGYGLLQ